MDLQNKSESLGQHLPYYLLLRIFQYLDLESIICCSQVCRHWRNITFDWRLYKNVSFKIYDSKKVRIFDYFIERGQVLKKLTIATYWDVKIDLPLLTQFLKESCQQLTHLDLINYFYPEEIFDQIDLCQNLTDLRLSNVYEGVFHKLENLLKLTKLKTFHLIESEIDKTILERILIANPNLEDIKLDDVLTNAYMGSFVTLAAKNNLKLTSWSSPFFDSKISAPFHSFPNLINLDLQFCELLEPEQLLQDIASCCPLLEKLYLGGCKLADGQMLLPIIYNCKNLRHLGVHANDDIPLSIYKKALQNLPNLKILHISVEPELMNEVRILKNQYPDVDINLVAVYSGASKIYIR